MLRLDQALLFLQGLVGEIPLQPFRCMLQGLFDLLRRGDDLDRSGQIASGAVRIAVASGEGKSHGAWAFTARRSIAAQYGVKSALIKRSAREGGVDQFVAELGGAFVRNGDGGELLAMGRQLLREIGESEHQRAGGRRVDTGR